jgi:hypothetical protein
MEGPGAACAFPCSVQLHECPGVSLSPAPCKGKPWSPQPLSCASCVSKTTASSVLRNTKSHGRASKPAPAPAPHEALLNGVLHDGSTREVPKIALSEVVWWRRSHKIWLRAAPLAPPSHMPPLPSKSGADGARRSRETANHGIARRR